MCLDIVLQFFTIVAWFVGIPSIIMFLVAAKVVWDAGPDEMLLPIFSLGILSVLSWAWIYVTW